MLPIQIIMQAVQREGITTGLSCGIGHCKQQLGFSEQLSFFQLKSTKQAVYANSGIPYQESQRTKPKTEETMDQSSLYQIVWPVANQIPLDALQIEQVVANQGLSPPVFQSVQGTSSAVFNGEITQKVVLNLESGKSAMQTLEQTQSIPTLDTGQQTSNVLTENKLHEDVLEKDIKTVLLDVQAMDMRTALPDMSNAIDKGRAAYIVNPINLSDNLGIRFALEGLDESGLLINMKNKKVETDHVKAQDLGGIELAIMDDQAELVQKSWEYRGDAVRKNLMPMEIANLKKEPFIVSRSLDQRAPEVASQKLCPEKAYGESIKDISGASIKKNATERDDFSQEQLLSTIVTNGVSKSESNGYIPSDLKREPIPQPIPDQIADKLVEISGSDKKELHIILKPENLGEVTLQIISDQEGITAKIITNNLQVKEEINQQGFTLKEQLIEQGIKINMIEVLYKEHTPAHNHFYGDSRQRHQQHQQHRYQQSNQQNTYYQNYSASQDEQEKIDAIVQHTILLQDGGINYFV